MNFERKILVAEIRQPHGLKGEVRVTSFAEDPYSLISYSPLQTSSGREIIVEKLRPTKDGWLAVFKGICNRNDSEALKGEKLFVFRSRLPDLPDGQWYQADLIGLCLLDQTGTEIGVVEALLNYGGGDLLEISLADKESRLLVPFTKANVNLEQGTIQVEIAEGLLDD